jgi:penicillin-binding protein 1A
MMVRMMQGVILHGTGKRADFGWPAAGKTGTSQNWRDAWFVGFTPEFVTSVWMGQDGNRPMRRVTGGDAPALAWRSFMIEAHRGVPVRDFDWLGPVPEGAPIPDYAPDTRNGFYEDLSAEFSRTAEIYAPTPQPEPPYEPYGEPAPEYVDAEPAPF